MKITNRKNAHSAIDDFLQKLYWKNMLCDLIIRKAFCAMIVGKYLAVQNCLKGMNYGITTLNKQGDLYPVIFVAKYPCINMLCKNILQESIEKKNPAMMVHPVIFVEKHTLRKKA